MKGLWRCGNSRKRRLSDPSASAHAKLFEPCRNFGTVGARVNLRQNVEDGAIGVDDVRPALGIFPALVDHPVRFGDLLVLVTQHGVVEIEGLGESTIGCGRITARRKEGDVVLVQAGPFGCREVDLLPTFELDDE